jgi:hypothetical protein|tara:strand:- start:3567 stop:3815 length:249 start_codon:yes stop_codon:yes gene_type:complete
MIPVKTGSSKAWNPLKSGFGRNNLKSCRKRCQKKLENLKPLFRKGKFIPAVDHQTPPEVSLENYRHYLKASEAFFNEVQKGS